MEIKEIKELLLTSDYDFLRDNEHLGENIVLLALGGSHAYGMNKEGSDVDVRGIALNSSEEILLGKDFKQVVETNTDTTIYSFNKMIERLTDNNPNTIEILGCRPEHYLYVSPIGQEILDHKNLFLSQKCMFTFAGYASSQLRRLENKAVTYVEQARQEAHILKSIENARISFPEKYFNSEDGSVNLFLDDTDNPDFEKEIFMDISLSHYPLRDWTGMWNEMKAIVSSYTKNSRRNENAISHDKLGKHMAHLIRLYMMCIDILKKGEVITYREAEHDLLMDIRNDKYLDDNHQPTPEFFELLHEYEEKFERAKAITTLPKLPDYEKINEFRRSVNERIVKCEL